ncbi:MAG: tRNA uracil 4-sulfurtransferase ThiI [Clostridiaceae bacterium]|nr:tRNA uracil 4-sulfurtransferase ThiI [Clostridiaceae bacterium]
MREILMLKCGELVLKGLNRHKFEDRLARTLRYRLEKVGNYTVSGLQSIYYVEPLDDAPIEPALKVCQKVFGAVSVCRAAVCEKEIGDICRIAGEYLAPQMKMAKTFRVATRRGDKRFPMTSPEIDREVGGYLSDLFPDCKAKMVSPELTVHVEIRERMAFVHADPLPGAGGIPTGSGGRGLLLLSGGIDSPVAGWMMAKRGMELGAVHFFSYPYTSEDAKQKVLTLARELSGWCGRIPIYIVPFTHIQTEIRDKCFEDYFTLVMRRMMMRISERVASEQAFQALITGESLGQVASQTVEAIGTTDAVCTIPVLRPVIGMDKEEIVQIARRAGTFETSILPYEDCCTVFTPRHPQTKPRLWQVEREEQKLDVQTLVDEAVAGIERIVIG